MTIKSKKKVGKDKPDPENVDVHQAVGHVHPHAHTLGHNLPHTHGHYHHASGSETRLEKSSRVRSSPTRWLPSTSGQNEYVHNHSNLTSNLTANSSFDHDVQSNHKRRHRSSPHRTVRKHHRNHTPAVANASGVASNSSNLVSLADDNEEDCDDDYSGYNSEDEHSQAPAVPDNVNELEQWFEQALTKKGFIIKKMGEDGACLFRAVADQVYGDQEMHGVVRKHCLDYMAKNAEYYSQYVTEDFKTYIIRKRMDSCHGNHLEIQAMTELFNRPVEVYQYSLVPMNTFDTACKTDNPPIRLSYHGNVHYNSIVDPYSASIGVGLGLPGFQPGLAERDQMKDAVKHSENFHIEKTMLEDKIRETDWEVTQDSIDEQVARESYLQWLREQEKSSRRTKGNNTRSASATCSSTSDGNQSGSMETGPVRSPRQLRSGNNSPQQNTSPPQPAAVSQEQFVSLPGSSKSPCHSPKQTPVPDGASSSVNTDHLTPALYGLSDWGEEDILAQVMAQSQQEYLDTLRRHQQTTRSSPDHSPRPPPALTFDTSSSSSASASRPFHPSVDVPGFSGGAAASTSSSFRSAPSPPPPPPTTPRQFDSNNAASDNNTATAADS